MSLLTKLRMIGLAGLAGLVIGCGSGDNANDSPKGCNLVTNYPCKTEEGRVCLPNPEKPGEGICAWKEEAGNDVETGKDIISKDTYSFPDNSVAKDNSQPVCESHAKTVCSDGDVYWKDSCGNLEDKSKSCDNGCSNGKCQGQTCDPHESKVCLDGDVYWQDSCGALEEKFESCVYSCSNGKCQGLPCDPQAKKVCDGDEIYWQDSCGNLKDWIKSCDYGCSDGKCLDQSCTDECDSGEDKCEKQDLYKCQDSNGDGCLGWTNSKNCVDQFGYCLDGGCQTAAIFSCNGSVLPYENICDGVKDCNDNSDENFCNELCPNQTNSCEDILNCSNAAGTAIEFYSCVCQGKQTSISKFFEVISCVYSNCGGLENTTSECKEQALYNECNYAIMNCLND